MHKNPMAWKFDVNFKIKNFIQLLWESILNSHRNITLFFLEFYYESIYTYILFMLFLRLCPNSPTVPSVPPTQQSHRPNSPTWCPKSPTVPTVPPSYLSHPPNSPTNCNQIYRRLMLCIYYNCLHKKVKNEKFCTIFCNVQKNRKW